MAGGQARHPLVRALATHEALLAVPAPDWHALANAAIFANGSEQACADVDAVLAQGAPYARITARIEARVFDATPAAAMPAVQSADASVHGGRSDGLAAAADAVAVHHVLRRLEHSLGRDATQFPWPLNLRARHQAAPESFGEWRTQPAARAVVKDLASVLASRVHALRGATAFRRAQAALDARRLRHLAGGRAEALRAAGPATLFALWRAARRG
jgi:anti-sigma-K factor RskA